jgi:D-alanyl-D-alanine carboxypeptidase
MSHLFAVVRTRRTRRNGFVIAAMVGATLGLMAPIASADPSQISVIHSDHPPAIEFPNNDLAVGAGANPVISDVPDGLWNRMTGYSWTQGCPIGRSDLKLVRVNFWGFDGVRSRGGLVVRLGQGDNVARIFTTFYDQAFRIRRMEPMADQFGKTVRNGVTYPGADDAEAMRKDNTSAFNCRYKTFDEDEHVWSPHRCGAAIDINPWENSEEEFDGGVLQGYHPNEFHFSHRGGFGKFTSADPQVTALSNNGYQTWGGNWNETDYMHFQNEGPSSC